MGPGFHQLACLGEELALEHGAELIDVSRLLGHANTAITGRIYAGKLHRSARRASDRVAQAFGDEEPEAVTEAASGEA